MDYSEFKCKWIDPASLWNVADEARNKYWTESRLPVNSEEIVEFRLRLNIEPVKHLLSTIVQMKNACGLQIYRSCSNHNRLQFQTNPF